MSTMNFVKLFAMLSVLFLCGCTNTLSPIDAVLASSRVQSACRFWSDNDIASEASAGLALMEAGFSRGEVLAIGTGPCPTQECVNCETAIVDALYGVN